MIFADKLIKLRKSSGYSQEELASIMSVSRQSVSKWESAQSIPDLDKMIKLSKIFGVSTDYLLKDEIEECDVTYSDDSLGLVVSVEEANEFMNIKKETSKTIALATSLCIVSPTLLIVLSMMAEDRLFGITEAFAEGIGLVFLIVVVAISVSIFIVSGSKTSKYDFLETETFDLAYGTEGIINENMKSFKPKYTLYNTLGTILCILSALPIIIAGVSEPQLEYIYGISVACTLVIVAIGVNRLVYAGIVWGSYNKLLQVDDFTKEKKKSSKETNPIFTIYWAIVIAIYLGYSFITFDWGRSWIIPSIAGVLSPAVLTLAKLKSKNKE